MRKTRPILDPADLTYLREERLCIIETSCNCTRAEAEKKLARMEAEAALKGTTVELFKAG
jgi:hypothetical protein